MFSNIICRGVTKTQFGIVFYNCSRSCSILVNHHGSLGLLKSNSNFALQTRNISKNYDKEIKLLPEDVTYRYDDEQFLNQKSFASPWSTEPPYIKRTDDEIMDLSKIKFEKDIETHLTVDPNQPPFNQVFEGQPDPEGRFTTTETVKDEDGSLWKNVERLMPKQMLGQLRPDSKLIPKPGPIDPTLPYYVKRTRNRLYPIYLVHMVVNRDHKHYWQNRWDHMFSKYNAHILDKLDEIKWENNEKTETYTLVNHIVGDIWQFEKDVREWLQQKHQLEHLLTGVNEVRSSVHFHGDFVTSLPEFFKEKGF